jgi:hypothetical protein
MPKQYGWFCGVLGSVLALAGPGCGGGKDRTVAVKGNVTLDGKSLVGALVTFVPKDPSAGRAAIGRTDANGRFQLSTYNTDDGALPGEYKVTVAYQEAAEGQAVDDPTGMDDKQKRAFYMRRTPEGLAKQLAEEAKRKARSPVPAVYADPARTPLMQVVPPAGDVELALKKTAR